MSQPRPSLSGTKLCTIAIYYATGNVRHHYCALITVHLMQIFVVKTLYYCNLLCYRKCTITVCTQSQLERRVREGHNKTRPYVHTYTLVPGQHILYCMKDTRRTRSTHLMITQMAAVAATTGRISYVKK